MVSPSAQPVTFLEFRLIRLRLAKTYEKLREGAARMVDYIVLLRARVKLYRERLEEEEEQFWQLLKQEIESF